MSDPQSRHVVIKSGLQPLLHPTAVATLTLGDIALDNDQRSTT
jgi:hypothetical protein